MTAFSTTTRQNLSTISRSHSVHKSVLISSFSFRWLKRSFAHCFVSLESLLNIWILLVGICASKTECKYTKSFFSGKWFWKYFFRSWFPLFVPIFFSLLQSSKKGFSLQSGLILLLSWNKRSKNSRLANSKLKNYLDFRSAPRTARLAGSSTRNAAAQIFVVFYVDNLMPRFAQGSVHLFSACWSSAENLSKNVCSSYQFRTMRSDLVIAQREFLLRLRIGLRRRRAERKETVQWTVLAKEPGGVLALFEVGVTRAKGEQAKQIKCCLSIWY